LHSVLRIIKKKSKFVPNDEMKAFAIMSRAIGSKNRNTYNTSKETAVSNAPDPFRPARFPEN
jgi:hypothetical protein